MSTVKVEEKSEQAEKAVETAGLSKMQLAAKKAWETIRKNKELKQKEKGEKLQSEVKEAVQEQKVKKQKKVKETGETEKAVKEQITEKDKKELKELNGDELVKLAKENGKRVEKNLAKQSRKSAQLKQELGMETVTDGSSDRAVSVGSIIENAKLELVEQSNKTGM